MRRGVRQSRAVHDVHVQMLAALGGRFVTALRVTRRLDTCRSTRREVLVQQRDEVRRSVASAFFPGSPRRWKTCCSRRPGTRPRRTARGDGVERSQRAVSVALVHGVRAGRERRAALAAVGVAPVARAVHHVRGDGQHGQRGLRVAVEAPRSRSLRKNPRVIFAAMSSTRGSSLPNVGQSPSVSNRATRPVASSTTGVTARACLIALRLSARQLGAGSRRAMNRLGSGVHEGHHHGLVVVPVVGPVDAAHRVHVDAGEPL